MINFNNFLKDLVQGEDLTLSDFRESIDHMSDKDLLDILNFKIRNGKRINIINAISFTKEVMVAAEEYPLYPTLTPVIWDRVYDDFIAMDKIGEWFNDPQREFGNVFIDHSDEEIYKRYGLQMMFQIFKNDGEIMKKKLEKLFYDSDNFDYYDCEAFLLYRLFQDVVDLDKLIGSLERMQWFKFITDDTYRKKYTHYIYMNL